MPKAKRTTPQCTATTKRGDQCRSSSLPDSDPPLCRRHATGDTAAHGKKAALLEAFELIGNVTDACAAAGVVRSTHYGWLDTDAEYAAAFADAREGAADRLEREAVRRARDGVAEPVFHKGEVVGHVQRYSDTLLIFLLKGLRPEKYRERYDVQGKVQHEGRVNYQPATDRLLSSLDEYAARGAADAEAHANGGG